MPLYSPPPVAGTNFSLNATSSSVSLSAGAGIGIGQAASTITMSASVQTSSISLTALGNTTGSSAGTFSNLLNLSGAGIVSVGAGDGSVTISARSASVVSALNNALTGNVSIIAGAGISIPPGAFSAITISNTAAFSTMTGRCIGNTIVSGTSNQTTFTVSNILSVSGAGAVSVGGSNSSLTISSPVATDFSLNASSSSVSLVAGANITFNSGANSITIVGPSPAGGGGVVSLNASSGSLSVSAGAGIGIGQAASTITVSASNQTSSLSYVAGLGTAAATSTGAIVLAAGANITLNTGANSITIVGAAAGTGGGVVSLNASSGSLSLSAGVGIGIGQAASTMTISALAVRGLGTVGAISQGNITLVAGANITLSTGVSLITIVGASGGTGAAATGKLLHTQNYDLNEMGVVLSKSGTVTSAFGFANSGFLHRIYLPAAMTLSEVDVAMSIGFNATSDGAGTMSRTLGVWSWSSANTTQLLSVFTASGTSAWTTGTSTTAGAASLTQFQGGWSLPYIQPMTFATTSLPAGDYIVGQRFDFAQAVTPWTVNFYGPTVMDTLVASAATNLTSAGVTAISSLGLVAGSGLTGISHYASPVVWIGGGGTAANAAGTVVMRQSAGVAASTYSNSKFDLTGSNSLAASFYFAQSANLTANTFFISNLGTVAGSVINASNTASFITNVALGALNSSTLASTKLANFGFIGTGSTTSARPFAFIAGTSFGALPTNFGLNDPALIYVGSAAAVQPWFALVGS